MLHPLPLPLSSCLGCIPPLIGLPSLRFYAVVSSLFLLSVRFCLCFSVLSRRCPLLATSLSVLFCLLSMLISDSRFDLVWFSLSCDHGWIRSGSVNVRKQQQTGSGSHPDHKRSRPPSSTVLDVLSTVSARARNRTVRVSWYIRFTRVRSPNLITQLRRTRTSSTVSPPVPTTVADPKQSTDLEQIRVATIALHTEKKNRRNLQEVQVSQRRTLSFLAGLPSPLLG